MRVFNGFRMVCGKSEKRRDLASMEDSVRQKAREMEILAEAYNFEDNPVSLHFFGDFQSDLKFRVECNDPKTKKRLTEVLKQYLHNHS